MIDVKEERAAADTAGTQSPIRIRKIGHVVYRVSDVDRSTAFWTDILGFKVSDKNENGMVFLRCQGDHHTIALVPCQPDAKLPNPNDKGQLGLNHFAMEVASTDELFRIRDF